MKAFRYTVVFGALGLLLLFLLYPLSLVLDASLRVGGTGTITLENYARIFASKYYGNSIANSLLAATFATLVVLPAVFAAIQARAHRRSPSLDPDDAGNQAGASA